MEDKILASTIFSGSGCFTKIQLTLVARQVCHHLLTERFPARINERKTLSDRRYLANLSRKATDELSIRCEAERSESAFFGFILAGNLC